MTRPSPRRRNKRGDGGLLRAQLLAAANDVLDRTGDPATVTVRGIAAEVGVAPAAVYLHFPDRDTLLTEMTVDRFAAFHATLSDAVATTDDPLEQLRRGHDAYCAFGLAHPGHYRLLFGASGLDPARTDLIGRRLELLLTAFDLLVMACQRCIDVGVFAPVDARQLASAIWTMEHGYVDIASGCGLPAPATPSELLDTLIAAFAASSGSSRSGSPVL